MSKLYTYQQISEHNSEKDLWLIIDNKVYDCSRFVDSHPGGSEVLIDLAGQDATEPFTDIGHSDNANKILCQLHVGDVDLNSEVVKPSRNQNLSEVHATEVNRVLWVSFILLFLVIIYYRYYYT